MLGGFFAGGLVEEALKFCVLYFYVLREKAFNEPMDAIVYGVVVSFGFATLENYSYVYEVSEQLGCLQRLLFLGFTAVPYALCGVIMGFIFNTRICLWRKKFKFGFDSSLYFAWDL